MQIILESERLLFRPHLITDLDDFCAMEMDASVRRYVGGYPRTREEAEKRFPKNQAGKVGKDRLAFWATIFKAENRYIGRCGLVQQFDAAGKQVPGNAALGFYIMPKYWGQGFASEAGRAFIDFGFNELGITCIVAAVQQGNEASLHVLQKLGLSIVNIEKGPRTFYHLALQGKKMQRPAGYEP